MMTDFGTRVRMDVSRKGYVFERMKSYSLYGYHGVIYAINGLRERDDGTCGTMDPTSIVSCEAWRPHRRLCGYSAFSLGAEMSIIIVIIEGCPLPCHRAVSDDPSPSGYAYDCYNSISTCMQAIGTTSARAAWCSALCTMGPSAFCGIRGYSDSGILMLTDTIH